MNGTLLVLAWVASSVVLVLVGIVLGSLLGRHGSVELVRFVMTIPILLVKAPGKIKTQWNIWHEFRALKKMDMLRRHEQIAELDKKVEHHRGEIRRLKTQIHRLKWGGG